jgi:hypothetical protein
MRRFPATRLALSERRRTITNAQGERMSGAHGHGHIEGDNKKIALLIAVLALCLALAETMAKGAQTSALSYNVEASNLWAFFQAKTIRQTVVRTAGEMADVDRARNADPAAADALAKRTDAWTKTVARWESEPETGEGRKELIARAKAAEEKRDTAMAKYHHYEVSSAAFQIAIVLASATVITGAMALTWLSIGLGVVGIAFAGIGLLAPHAVHLL